MAKSHNQKAKILFLVKMLLGTGENRVVTMQDILAQLTACGISAERKSIYDDFEALREFGFDIRFKRGRPGGYYLANGGPFAEWTGQGGSPAQKAEDSARGEKTGGPAGQEEERKASAAELRQIGAESEKPEEEPKETEGKRTEEENLPGEWKFSRESAAGEEKKMRLLCSLKREKEIREYFGDEGEYKERGYGNFTLAVPLRSSPSFYGWLASMEKDVYIIKPRKAALAYREYLKKIAREYKGI